jgi:hypothetical protein
MLLDEELSRFHGILLPVLIQFFDVGLREGPFATFQGQDLQ